MRLSKLVSSLNGAKIIYGGDWEREIISLHTDSRKTSKSSLFICLSGANSDGHEYALEAVKKGAVAIVTERELSVGVPQFVVEDTREAVSLLASSFYGKPTEQLKVVGITGTNGKTTTSYMLAEILKSAGKNVGVIGTLGVQYGRKRRSSELTTPDPIELQEIFADMLLCGMEYVVMEVSAHALYYKKVAGVCFSACIFTNLTQDHLDFFPSMQSYKEAKSTLFLPKVAPVAIMNGDDETGREFGRLREEKAGKNVFYGLNSPADCFAIVTDENLQGSECMLNLNDKLCRVRLRMTGQHNVYNALAAAACAAELGIDGDAMAQGLSNMKGVCGRLQNVGALHGAEIYVDFAHTPDGLAKSLDTLKKHCKGRLVCLFGCGGNRDKSKRAIMGETAAKKSDFTVLTSDNPRYEDPLDIITDIERGYRRYSPRYVVVPDRKKAIDYALDFLQKDDVLLVAGKGGETYQEIMGIKYAFNDNDIIGKLLQQKEKKPLI